MAIDFGGWSTADNYQTAFVPKMNEALAGLARMLDPATVSYSGTVPTGAKRLSAGVLESFNGSSWTTQTINGLTMSGGQIVFGQGAGQVALLTMVPRLLRVDTSSQGGRMEYVRATDNLNIWATRVLGANWQLQDLLSGDPVLHVTPTRLGVGNSDPRFTIDALSGKLRAFELHMGFVAGAGENSLARFVLQGSDQVRLLTGAATFGFDGAAANPRIAAVSGTALRLGVGSANPLLLESGKATVDGQLVQSGTTDTPLKVANTTAGSKADVQIASDDRVLLLGVRSSSHAGGALAYLSAVGSSPLELIVNGATRMRWPVGSAETTLYGPLRGNGASLERLDSGDLALAASHASGEVAISAGGQTALRVKPSGRVGVMKALPARTLDVAGSAMTSAAEPAYSAALSVDALASNVFVVGTLTGNVTSMVIANAQQGQFLTLRFRQDATGGRTVALPAGAKVSGQIEGGANRSSYLSLTWSAVDNRWEGNWFVVPA